MKSRLRLTLFTLAGILLGAAGLHPLLAGCGWLGLAVLAFALRGPAATAPRLLGVALAMLLANVMTPLSTPLAVRTYFPTHGLLFCAGLSFLLWCFAALAPTVVLSGAVLIGNPVRRLRRPLLLQIPAALWLPPLWLLGELGRRVFMPTSFDWLYNQWQVQGVLRCIAKLGYYPTLLLCISASAALSDSLHTRRLRSLAPMFLFTLLTIVLPPLPRSDPSLFRGIGLVYIDSKESRIQQLPPSLSLIIWPEGAIGGEPKISEQQAKGRQLPLPLLPPVVTPPEQGPSHLYGIQTRLQRGYIQNSIIAQDPQGRVLGMRAKQVLVPLMERPFLPQRTTPPGYFLPGQAPPLLEVGARRIIPLVCIEVVERALFADGKRRGGDLVAVLSSDRAFAGLASSNRLMLGSLVLRAVEYGVPAVRASRAGYAAFIGTDGTVWALSELGESGVLTLDEQGAARAHDALGRPQ